MNALTLCKYLKNGKFRKEWRWYNFEDNTLIEINVKEGNKLPTIQKSVKGGLK